MRLIIANKFMGIKRKSKEKVYSSQRYGTKKNASTPGEIEAR